MSGELHQNTEAVINLHCLIRDKVCREVCPGGRYCRDMVCLEAFFRVAGQIEIMTEGQHVDKF